MKQYLDLLKEIKTRGVFKSDRTGTGTTSLFGYQMRFDLAQGFPLVTTKKIFTKGIIHELLWLISGSTNIKYLQDNDVHIWDAWADKNGELGPVYGEQWRSWPDYNGNIDQLSGVIEQIKTNPDSRRLIVTAWNPSVVEEMALPPCHCFFQFYVSERRLSCHLYQRSADVFLGVPFNIASYALLTEMVAQVCDLDVGDFVHTFGDVHIYSNHHEQVDLQLSREPMRLSHLKLNTDIKNIDDFGFKDINIVDYNHYSVIKAEISI